VSAPTELATAQQRTAARADITSKAASGELTKPAATVLRRILRHLGAVERLQRLYDRQRRAA